MSDGEESARPAGPGGWGRTVGGLAAVLAAAGAVQAWLRPGSRIETLSYLHRDVPFWKSVLEGHLEFPLRRLTDAWMMSAIEAGLIAGGVVFVALLLWRAKDIAAVLREDLAGRERSEAPAPPVLSSGDRRVALALLAAFAVLYFAAGQTLAETRAFDTTDVLFENDTPRSIQDIAVAGTKHRRSQVHPLFVVLLNPVGSQLAPWVGGARTAAVALNAILAGLGVALAYGFFRIRGGERGTAVALAVVFGLSASQLLFGAIPGTNALAACSLIGSYGLFWLCLGRRRLWLWAWIAVGVLSFGVTLTNFVQTFVCFAALAVTLGRHEGFGPGRAVARAFVLGTLVVAIAAVLAALQSALFHKAEPFFLPGSYEGEARNATLAILGQPVMVAVQLAKALFLVDFVAPVPNTWRLMQEGIPAVTFTSSWNYSAFGWAAAALWISVLASGTAAFARLRRREPAFVAAITLCLLFNLALHSVYGVGEKGKIEYFVYSGNFTFLVFVVASSAWLKPAGRAGRGRLVVLATLLAINGAWILAKLIELYSA